MKERIHTFHTPNLTPDPKTGHIYNWTEEQFVARFKAGKIYKDSPMAWRAFSKIPDVELKAIYKYLKSLDPVENEVGPTVTINKKEALAAKTSK